MNEISKNLGIGSKNLSYGEVKQNKKSKYKQLINPNICARILTLKKRTLIKGGRRLTRGGSRPGAGRTHIDGKEIKIKVPDKVMEQLDLFFPGKTMQERIRDCLEFGISQMNSNHGKLIDESCQPNVIDLFSGAGGLLSCGGLFYI